MHSLAGSSTSRTFLGFTAASSGTCPQQQGTAKPISPPPPPPPPPPPEKHKTSSYALHRARVPMKTYDYINFALRRCLVPFFHHTLAPPERINTTLRFNFSRYVIRPPPVQIIHCPWMRQIRLHQVPKLCYGCTRAAMRLYAKCWKTCFVKLAGLGNSRHPKPLATIGGKPERSPPCVIPMYSGLGRSSAAIFYSLYGNSRFSLESTDAERRGALRKCVYLATRSSNTLNGSSNLVYDFSCFMCVGCMM